MLVVVALGGNALRRGGQPLEAAVQRANAARAAEVIAEVAVDHRVVLTHGNGPQVGLLGLQNDACDEVAAYPLDLLEAESNGMIGYLLEQELGRHLPRERLATLLTQVIVAADDPAFRQPSTFVGPPYDEGRARSLAVQRGWTVAPDGPRWRRVVASPEPLEVVELHTIKLLVEHRVVVVCAGGGGIPVVRDRAGGLVGVEAVIDKDLSASLLAGDLDATALVLLTDVDGVYAGWGTAEQHLLRKPSLDELRSVVAPAGSMGPKIEAVCRFIEAGGRFAAIGALRDAAAIMRGEAGTILVGSGVAPASQQRHILGTRQTAMVPPG